MPGQLRIAGEEHRLAQLHIVDGLFIERDDFGQAVRGELELSLGLELGLLLGLELGMPLGLELGLPMGLELGLTLGCKLGLTLGFELGNVTDGDVIGGYQGGLFVRDKT